MQVRQIISRNGRHPQVQLFAKASGEHPCKRLDMACSCFEVPAAGENLLEPDLPIVGEVVGMPRHPRGDPPHFRHLSVWTVELPLSCETGEGNPERSCIAAAISQFLKFFVKCSSVGMAVVETLVKIFGELVQHSWQAGSRCPNNSSTLFA